MKLYSQEKKCNPEFHSALAEDFYGVVDGYVNIVNVSLEAGVMQRKLLPFTGHIRP